MVHIQKPEDSKFNLDALRKATWVKLETQGTRTDLHWELRRASTLGYSTGEHFKQSFNFSVYLNCCSEKIFKGVIKLKLAGPWDTKNHSHKGAG